MEMEMIMNKNNNPNHHIQILNLLVSTFTNVWTMKMLAQKSDLPYSSELTRLAEVFSIHMMGMSEFNNTIQSDISDEFMAECLKSGDYKHLKAFAQFAEEVNKKSA